MLINKHNLAVADFAPKEESRYNVKGIQVSDKGTVATNGHYLVHVTLPKVDVKSFPSIEGFVPSMTGSVASFILPADAAKKIQAAIPKEKNLTILKHACIGEPGQNTANIAVTDLDTTQVFKPRPLTQQFPSWESVIPRTDPTFEIILNGEYLAQLAKAATAFTDNSGQAILLRFRGDNNAVEILAANSDTGQTWEAVLMPMRDAGIKAQFAKKKEPQTVDVDVEVSTETVA